MCPRKLGGHNHPLSRPDSHASSSAIKVGFGGRLLREYQKVARQCAAEGLDHVRFLTRLVELELIDRERRMVERRIKAAKFPATKSLDCIETTKPSQIAA